MKTSEIQLDEQGFRELVEVLDDEQTRIERTLGDLDRLRAAMIQKDESGLRDLLRDVQERHAESAELDRRREAIRGRLAERIGVDKERMNLTRLIRGLTGEWKQTIQSRQNRLRGLARLLKMEHRLTALLLADCSRLNRALLRAMLGGGNEPMMYNAQGRSNWELQDRMVSVRM